eukprot:scaffold3716_cov23-Tisochrysis_lutea.AAC.4
MTRPLLQPAASSMLSLVVVTQLRSSANLRDRERRVWHVATGGGDADQVIQDGLGQECRVQRAATGGGDAAQARQQACRIQNAVCNMLPPVVVTQLMPWQPETTSTGRRGA